MMDATNETPLHYLDHAATTPLLPEAIEAMAEVTHGGLWANPSGGHLLARRARRAADDARDELAELFGALPSEVVFTSGATEANNIAILGAARANSDKRHLITTAVEHPSVLEPCRQLEREGWDITVLGVDEDGKVAPSDVAASSALRMQAGMPTPRSAMPAPICTESNTR